jgi:hypothetical protein
MYDEGAVNGNFKIAKSIRKMSALQNNEICGVKNEEFVEQKEVSHL